MAKIHLTTRAGSKVVIEGAPDEVAVLVRRLEGEPASQLKSPSRRSTQSRTKPTPTSLLGDLIDGGFFKKPKELSAIKAALQEQGHHYPVTSLSPTVLRFVRRRLLRRLKDAKRWLYVQ